MAFVRVIIALAIVGAVITPTLAKDIAVGDESGWKLNFDYQAWAEGKEFHIGDRLIFNYTKESHNVLKVDGVGFQQCAKPDGIEPLNSGNDVITLASPGKKWYICGVANHCASGMKLVINVTPNLGSSAPAPSPSSTPESAAVREMALTFFAGMISAFGIFMMI
ncbi:hypothetical protein ACH5RR_041467 [Cinchona calisaya]|uniref:Phytocyanin domain-containing protein n=1 Tax=Cinchona calisaya TaxID=153742 RepID=A0ABD2XXM6_9GENT